MCVVVVLLHAKSINSLEKRLREQLCGARRRLIKHFARSSRRPGSAYTQRALWQKPSEREQRPEAHYAHCAAAHAFNDETVQLFSLSARWRRRLAGTKHLSLVLLNQCCLCAINNSALCSLSTAPWEADKKNSPGQLALKRPNSQFPNSHSINVASSSDFIGIYYHKALLPINQSCKCKKIMCHI
jgi:hypothetical protein